MMQLGFALAATAALLAQTPATQTADATLTPGAVLLLANSTDPATPQALQKALGSQDPVIRETAGRVIAATHQTSLRGAMIGALAREQDPAAGAELVRDLLWLSGKADLQVADTQARRFGGRALLPLAEWLAREQPVDFSARLAEFSTLLADRASALGHLVSIACRQHPTDSDHLLHGWMTVAPPGGWNPTLTTVFGVNGISPAEGAVVVDALASTRADVREPTVWFVVDLLLRKQDVPRTVLEAAAQSPEGSDPWEGFGRELIARAIKKAPATDRREVLVKEGPAHRGDLIRLRDATLLTDGERQALSTLLDPAPPPTPFSGAVVNVVHGASPERTLPGFAPGVVASTLSAARCDVKGNGAALAVIEYADDGTPRHLDVDPSGLSSNCLAAWMALSRTARAAPEQFVLPNDHEILVMPLNDAFVTCADARQADSAPPRLELAPASRIQSPHKTRNVNPSYPNLAQARRIAGVVVVEARIAETGCISDARVVRTIPMLDVEALKAVSQWVFDPRTLDGPVLMTVTVNFTLR